jgi:hypothetical protein
MKKKIDINYDYKRALIILQRTKTPMDLLKYWSIAGPCMEQCPDIEKIIEKK